jgi:hypothetical protein
MTVCYKSNSNAFAFELIYIKSENFAEEAYSRSSIDDISSNPP